MYTKFNKKFNKEVVTIFPGEIYASSTGMVIATVLGSCISVCLIDKKNKIAGMNHFMLPLQKNTGNEANELLKDKKNYYTSQLRYGTVSMEHLIAELQKMGAERKNFTAKIFGGASIMDSSTLGVGQMNIEFTRKYLQIEKIPIENEDVAGNHGRSLYYLTDENRVLLKHLDSTFDQEIEKEEKSFIHKVKDENKPGSVDLF